MQAINAAESCLLRENTTLDHYCIVGRRLKYSANDNWMFDAIFERDSHIYGQRFILCFSFFRTRFAIVDHAVFELPADHSLAFFDRLGLQAEFDEISKIRRNFSLLKKPESKYLLVKNGRFRRKWSFYWAGSRSDSTHVARFIEKIVSKVDKGREEGIL